MGDACVRQRAAGPKVVALRRDGAGPAGQGPAKKAPAPVSASAPKPKCDELRLSSECRKAIDFAAAGSEAARKVVDPTGPANGVRGSSDAVLLPAGGSKYGAGKPDSNLQDLPDAPSAALTDKAGLGVRKDRIPVLSDDQLNSLLKGHEYLVYPQPGGTTGGIIGNFRVVGYAVDQEAWNRLGRPEGFMPIAYLRTHLEVGPVGADILIKGKTARHEQKVSVDVRDITWKGEDVEKLAKDWALDFARKNPGVAIPAAVVIVAGGVVGAYYYSKENGPIEFSAGSVRVFKYNGVEGSLKAKAQVDADPMSVKLNGVEGRLKYDIPGDHGRVEAGARYNLRDDLWRVETNYGMAVGKQGYFGAGAWAEQRLEHGGDREWEYGAGVYFGVRF